MKKVTMWLLVLALVAGASFYWYRSAFAYLGTLNLYEGRAEIQRGNGIIEGKTGAGIRNTDTVKVEPESRVSIILKDGSVIRLEAGSLFEVAELAYERGEIKDASFRLKTGKMWSKVKPLPDDAEWQVETPTTVAAVRGTSFNTRYSDASTGISVYDGMVGVALLTDRTNEKLLLWNNSIKLGDASLEEDFAKDPTVLDPTKFDEWVLFNLEEDAKLDNKAFVSPLKSTTTDEMLPQNRAPVEPKTSTPPPKPIVRTLSSLLLYGNKSNILVGEETKLRVQAKYSDGSTEEVSFEKITWIKNNNLGIISAPGYYSSSRPTSMEVRAKVGEIISNPVSINVKETLRVLKRIEVSYIKNSSSQYQTYYEYPTAQFKAMAFFDDGTSEDVTSKAYWSASGTAGGTINESGFYSPKTRGEDTVEATFEGKSHSVTISIP